MPMHAVDSVMSDAITLEPMLPAHWLDVRRIYDAGIATGDATFETKSPEWAALDAAHLGDCRLIARRGDAVVGWAALSPVSSRCVYGGVAEVSVYIAPDAAGQGVGSLLLARLVEASEARGIWTLQAGIFPENRASLALHAKHGFRTVGRRERLGKLHGVWRDVMLLERRSANTGAT